MNWAAKMSGSILDRVYSGFQNNQFYRLLSSLSSHSPEIPDPYLVTLLLERETIIRRSDLPVSYPSKSQSLSIHHKLFADHTLHNNQFIIQEIHAP